MRRYFPFIVAVLAIAAIALYVIRSRAVYDSGSPPEPLSKLALDARPKTIPAAAFFNDKGERLSLATFRGHPVLLNLWATWCAPCVKELPALAQLQHALPALTIVAVSEGRENARETSVFLKAHAAGELKVYVDNDHAFLAAIGVSGLPLSALIDSNGFERARASGPEEWDDPAAVAYLNSFVSGTETTK